MTFPPPSPRRWLARGLRLLAAYAVTALAAAFITIRFSARGSTVTVPDLTGLDVREVRRVLADHGLELGIAREDWNELVPADCVVSQQPPAESRVKRGRRVRVDLSRGSEMIRVPSLGGSRLDEAEFLLRQLGVEPGSLAYVPSPADRQRVLASAPPAGTEIVRGSPITLLLSAGPPPAVFAMPRVTGQPARTALARLRQAGLRVTEVSYETTTLFVGGDVMGQDPPAGFRAADGQEVRLRAARSASAGQARYVEFQFVLEEGPARRVRILIVDEGGRREIANDIEQGGGILRFSTRVQGEAVAQFFVAGTLIEERKI